MFNVVDSDMKDAHDEISTAGGCFKGDYVTIQYFLLYNRC